METGTIVTYIISASVVGFILYSFLKTRKIMNKPPSDKIKILTDANFIISISKGVSLVDFWAVWCTPCKVQGPIVDEVAEEMDGRAKICKLDVDKNQKIAQQFGIQSIPTIAIFKDGKLVEKMVGVKPKKVLLNAINNHL